jgi:hypothetical protein
VFGELTAITQPEYVAGLSWLHTGGTQYAGEMAGRLAGLFAANLRNFVDGMADDVRAAGPRVG